MSSDLNDVYLTDNLSELLHLGIDNLSVEEAFYLCIKWNARKIFSYLYKNGIFPKSLEFCKECIKWNRFFFFTKIVPERLSEDDIGKLLYQSVDLDVERFVSYLVRKAGDSLNQCIEDQVILEKIIRKNSFRSLKILLDSGRFRPVLEADVLSLLVHHNATECFVLLYPELKEKLDGVFVGNVLTNYVNTKKVYQIQESPIASVLLSDFDIDLLEKDLTSILKVLSLLKKEVLCEFIRDFTIKGEQVKKTKIRLL